MTVCVEIIGNGKTKIKTGVSFGDDETCANRVALQFNFGNNAAADKIKLLGAALMQPIMQGVQTARVRHCGGKISARQLAEIERLAEQALANIEVGVMLGTKAEFVTKNFPA